MNDSQKLDLILSKLSAIEDKQGITRQRDVRNYEEWKRRSEDAWPKCLSCGGPVYHGHSCGVTGEVFNGQATYTCHCRFMALWGQTPTPTAPSAPPSDSDGIQKKSL